MDAAPAIVARLVADPEVSALIGSRVRPIAVGDEPLPYVTYRIISDRPTHTLSGASGLHQARAQVESWAGGYAQSKALAAAVRAALQGHYSAAGVAVHQSRLDDESDLAVVVEEGEGVGPFAARQDYLMAYGPDESGE